MGQHTIGGDVVNDGNPLSVAIESWDETDPLPVTFDQASLGEDAVAGSASIPAGTVFVTVLSYTPTEDKIVTFFNADVGAIIAQNFRVRLRVGGVTKLTEALSSTNMGVIPTSIRVPAGVAVEVQVVHGEVAAQTYEASISYRKA